LLLSWTASENTNHPLPSGPPYGQYGAPTAYRIETSANSTNGSDGDWALALPPITNNTLTARTHRIPFENQRWLRFVVLGDANTLNDGVRIHEIELHDNSDGKIDGWFFFGDSITAEAFNREASQNPAFATLLWAADQSHYPMQLNGGDGGDRAECDNQRPCSRDRLRQALDENDGIRVVALGLGTNGSTNTEVYRNSMRALIQEVQSRGKIAIIPRIPWANRLGTHPEAEQEAKNRVVDELTQEFGLPKGPDFYAHFKANPGQLRDNLHPNAQGFKEMNRLWAEAVNAAKAAGTFSKP
jgi:lysophospholipase L1-like esterase